MLSLFKFMVQNQNQLMTFNFIAHKKSFFFKPFFVFMYFIATGTIEIEDLEIINAFDNSINGRKNLPDDTNLEKIDHSYYNINIYSMNKTNAMEYWESLGNNFYTNKILSKSYLSSIVRNFSLIFPHTLSSTCCFYILGCMVIV